MLRLFVSSITAMSPSSSRLQPPNRLQNPNPNTSSTCNHSPSATLDLILLLLVLSSLAFLLASSLAHIGRSLSPFLSPLAAAIGASPLYHLAAPLILLLLFVLILAAAAIALSCRCRRRRLCRNPQCLGLKQALEFDVQMQTEESIRDCGGGDPAAAASWKEIDELPWKGGQGGNNPDYECVRAELRKLAPPNGRAVLLFRARCGCPITKLEAWGPKRGRRHKKLVHPNYKVHCDEIKIQGSIEFGSRGGRAIMRFGV